jgi:hypothetical protein
MTALLLDRELLVAKTLQPLSEIDQEKGQDRQENGKQLRIYRL